MTLISSCIVMKWNDDHLVAYIQSSNIGQNQIHEHCQTHLPPHMIPSKFIILDRFPLNSNGKVNRKGLPPPNRNAINIGLFFQYPTIVGHARVIGQATFVLEDGEGLLLQAGSCSVQKSNRNKSDFDSLLIIDESARYEYFSVTDLQQAYLIGREGFFDLGHVSTFAYSEYDLPSIFDIDRLEKALNYIVKRHEALRLRFPSNMEQVILEKVPYYKIAILNLTDVVSVEKLLLERRQELSHQVRPANQWPLFDIQATRFTMNKKNYIRLHISFDALILDNWSAILIFDQLNQLYLDTSIAFARLTLSYRDYVMALEEHKHTIDYENDKQYWINRLVSFPLGPSLPLSCLPNEIHIQRHCSSSLVLDKSPWQKLRQIITENNWTPAGFLVSVYAIVLSKWSENKHFALNLPVFNRLPIHPQVNEIAGDFTSILPLEINLNEPIILKQLIEIVQKQLWSDLAHLSYSGTTFIRDLMQKHNTREIVLPFVFTCGIDIGDISQKNTPQNTLFDEKPVYSINQTPQVYLDHIVHETGGQLFVQWIYVENLFSSEMIVDMHHTFINLLEKLATFDDMWHRPLFIALPFQQQERRSNFIRTQWKSNVKGKLLHSLVIEQAEQTPNAWAILSMQKHLTYKQLMNFVYSLAYHLQQHIIQSNQLIAILMKKGWQQIVACLAILLSGAAYLPLDIDSPYDRLLSLIDESNVKIILIQSDCQHVFPHLTTITVDTFTSNDYPKPFPMKQQSPTDLAYVIYTSGSTGKPKGVMISHQAVLNTVIDINTRLNISSKDRIFALSHMNFDLSVYDIFGMLIGGGAIVIPDYENYKNPQYWYDMIIKYHVTIWNSVPMLMQILIEHLKESYNPTQLRHILLSGDYISLSLPKSIQTTFGQQVTITSLGGATEASIWSIAYTLPKNIPQEWKSIPYGVPLRNQEYHIYDEYLDDCPEWVNGELYISGVGLAEGYWNDREKTERSFIIHPRTRQHLYRTGDYGRFIPDGYIEFIGRKDFQVKIHGHRIELGEIEYHLQQHTNIHQALVAFDKISQQLIGYILPETHSHNQNEFDQSETSLTDPIDRTSFKLARHGIQHQYKDEKSYPLTKPKLTETLINRYYARKSYRQFTNEIIETATIEYLLKKCFNNQNGDHKPLQILSFDALSQLLSVLTPINLSDQPLPKYRYASAGSLYPVQIYIELPALLNNISSGLYYHNPDRHSLELINSLINCNNIGTRLHLIGRSSAIAPLYGKTLASQFCVIETGYIMGLLQEEATKLGLVFTELTHNEAMGSVFDLAENDTHFCFEISSLVQQMFKNDYPQCIVYQKFPQKNKEQWFIYVCEKKSLISLDVAKRIMKEDIPLFFDTYDDTKIIFHDCQTAIFFVGQPMHRLNTGFIAHLIMDKAIAINIGTCPIGGDASFPIKIRDALSTIRAHLGTNEENILLHTLLIGKVTDEQKYERTISTVRSISDYNIALKTYLRDKLPPYMIPSYFMKVSAFPLNSNGKIDRTALPEISLSILQNVDTCVTANTPLEKAIVNIWENLLDKDRSNLSSNESKLNEWKQLSSNREKNASWTCISSSELSRPDIKTLSRVSTTANFFSLGGNSLLLIQLYQQYQSLFHFDSEVLTIRPFFEYNTIVEHAKLLEKIIDHDIETTQWQTLHINQGTASFAQERIFLDEQLRFSRKIAVYNELTVLRVTQGSLPIDRLSQALRYVLDKHKILQTSLIFDAEDSNLKQYIKNDHRSCLVVREQIFENENKLMNIICETTVNSDLLNLSNGHVFHCEILRQQKLTNENYDEKLINDSDILIIAFHHAVFDRSCAEIFFKDLVFAYNNNTTIYVDDDAFQYIDYAVYERSIDMEKSQNFWYSQLEEYNLKQSLRLPFDRHRSSTDQRSGLASVIHISFDNNISASFLNYASSHQLTPFQLGLATFYTFLFKLTHHQNDLCISGLSANRYRAELQNMIGMFVSTLPYRLQLDSDWSFDELVEHVQKKCLSVLEHSHYPLQHILTDFHVNQSNISFLETIFDFVTTSLNADQTSFDGAIVEQVSLHEWFEAAKFDFLIRFIYNPISDHILSCSFICCRDLFEEKTVTQMNRRFQSIFERLFSENSNVMQIDQAITSINKLSLILPEELREIETLIFFRQEITVNQGM
ncbi:unnamed protein product [Adineta steineri]|uniref:Non-ribosomal peptide synthetase n=1 Tax=Adineta steineri TaxID=433720 RepID=A0A819TJI6_9BILA|nr:unnamed protein product [Adineta steineri]